MSLDREYSSYRCCTASVIALTAILTVAAVAQTPADTSASAPTIEFSDKPNFTIAGVTDWTAAGGHGSDSILRTSEDMARDTLALKPPDSSSSLEVSKEAAQSERDLRAALAGAPGSFEANRQLGRFYLNARRYREAMPLLSAAYQIDSSREDNAYDLALACEGAGELSQGRELVQRLLDRRESARLRGLAGQLAEESGDPLAAVRHDQRAVHLDPSEQNYFKLGTELLLHRAVWQAIDVFKDGVRAYPKSLRMLTGLGSALFAGALYDQAALRFCDASDLDPADEKPYLFMGKAELASPTPLPCVEPRLARFVKQQPQNALANYLYAMAIMKRQEQPPIPDAVQQAEKLLEKAVAINPNYMDPYLELGVLSSSLRNDEKAIGFYLKAIEVNPRSSEAHYRLGLTYDRMREPGKAKQEFLLHDEIERQKAAAVERERQEIKQFIVVQGPASPAPR